MEKISTGRWRVNGTMRLDDFRREYPSLGEVPEVETMGGLLTHLIGIRRLLSLHVLHSEPHQVVDDPRQLVGRRRDRFRCPKP